MSTRVSASSSRISTRLAVCATTSPRPESPGEVPKGTRLEWAGSRSDEPASACDVSDRDLSLVSGSSSRDRHRDLCRSDIGCFWCARNVQPSRGNQACSVRGSLHELSREEPNVGVFTATVATHFTDANVNVRGRSRSIRVTDWLAGTPQFRWVTDQRRRIGFVRSSGCGGPAP